jgi:hypothetical protein
VVNTDGDTDWASEIDALLALAPHHSPG